MEQSDIDRSCVVSVGLLEWRLRGIDRIYRSCRDVKWSGKTLLYRGEYPDMCPPTITHGKIYKAFAIKKAVELGSRYILWIDPSIWPIKCFEEVFQSIKEDGHLFFYNGYSVGEWCRDSSLRTLGLTRDESFEIPEVTGAIFGLDMSRAESISFVEELIRYSNDGETFVEEPSENVNALCSGHPKVRGHRSDQTAMSIIVSRMNMKRMHCPKYYACFNNRTSETCFVDRGM